MTRAEVFLSDCVLYRTVHCDTAHRTKERFASSVKDPECAACWSKGSRLLACQYWINEDNSGLITVLLLRTGTKRIQVLSPLPKSAFLYDHLPSPLSLVHLVLSASGSEGLHLTTVIWAHSPTLLHCRVSKDMMQRYSWTSLDMRIGVIAAKPWEPSRYNSETPRHFRKSKNPRQRCWGGCLSHFTSSCYFLVRALILQNSLTVQREHNHLLVCSSLQPQATASVQQGWLPARITGIRKVAEVLFKLVSQEQTQTGSSGDTGWHLKGRRTASMPTAQRLCWLQRTPCFQPNHLHIHSTFTSSPSKEKWKLS